MKNTFARLLAAIPLLVSVAVHGQQIDYNFNSTAATPYQNGYSYTESWTAPSNVQLLSTSVVGAPGVTSSGWQNGQDLGSQGPYMYNVPTETLNDTTGAPTGATLTVAPSSQTALNGMTILPEQNTWNSGTVTDPTLSPTDILINSSVVAGGGNAAEFQLKNIPYLQYNLYVIMSVDTYESGSLQLFTGGVATGAQAPLYYTNGLGWYPLSPYGGYPDGGATQITSTDSSNPTVLGNTLSYVEFSGLSGADQTFDLVGQGGVAGFQIVDTPAVPEPNTWAMLALGTVGLAAWRRLRLAK